MRAWGNMGWPVAAGEDVTKTENFKRRLWVAAVDPTVGTVDPSHPAFYLAGQDDTPNMRGFWANAQCIATPAPGQSGGACDQGFECCSGFCTNGTCVERQHAGVPGDRRDLHHRGRLLQRNRRRLVQRRNVLAGIAR